MNEITMEAFCDGCKKIELMKDVRFLCKGQNANGEKWEQHKGKCVVCDQEVIRTTTEK